MSVERIIGIDFGTSTSVMRVKRYQENGQPVDDRLYTAEVKFANSSLVPTLIRKMQAGEPYYGYEAQKEHKKSTLFDNFKVNLESPDSQAKEQARALTEEFFAYLAKQYKDQSSGGFFGEADETERTLISYPVKWGEETRSFMLEAAKKAGFKNVEGMDEAQAAITAVMVQSADYLSQRGYLQNGVPANILMADMGAGTTDMVLCRYTPGNSAKYEILSAWPKDGGTLFGGREVEGMLQDFLRNKLPEEDVDTVMKKCRLDMFKSWKEDYVSPALARDEAVTECADMEMVTDLLEIDVEEYSLDRAAFEKMASQYLKGFPTLVNGCLKDAGLSGEAVDLVLLTGGHSQWYFVREQLCGRLDRFGAVGLGKIQDDPERIIPVPRPQETVALGLVYSPLLKGSRFAGNEESGAWDESMRVLPVTPEEEFEFQEIAGTYEVKVDINHKYAVDALDGYKVVKYQGNREVVSIPSKYKGRPVVAIEANAFNKQHENVFNRQGKNVLALRQVEIPGSCKIIGESAFANIYCNKEMSLNKVILHPGVQIIGLSAFEYNVQLSTLELPNGLLEIGYGAFSYCDIKKIYIPAKCKCIRDHAFVCNYNLSEVFLSADAKMKNIGENAFSYSKVERIKLPRSCGCEKLVRSPEYIGKKSGAILPSSEELITIEYY